MTGSGVEDAAIASVNHVVWLQSNPYQKAMKRGIGRMRRTRKLSEKSAFAAANLAPCPALNLMSSVRQLRKMLEPSDRRNHAMKTVAIFV